ncbi:MAG: hypothetical protein ACON4H_15720 [Rubripirellula sp.]
MSKPSLTSLVLILVAVTASMGQASSAWADTPNDTATDRETHPEDQIFRPTPGQFPPVHLAHTYRGELVFTDHANRRGSLRVEGSGMFFRNDPHPFALLPYAEVRYRNAPADLKDIPLGTILRVTAYLPPDPELSSVPVLPIDNRERDANHNRGAGIFPAENHVLLLEDEPSYCQRTSQEWQLNKIKVHQDHGTVHATQVHTTQPDSIADPELMTIDSATRIWRGRERLTLQEWAQENQWEENREFELSDLRVQLGIVWKPTPEGIFTRFHVSDIWLDELSLERSRDLQVEVHKQFIRARWMPAWVDSVEYGEFGQATVTATLFGGMHPSLYSDFKPEDGAMMNPVEATLKHTHGAYGPAHMACRGPIIEVIRSDSKPPLGSSGIQIRFKTDLIIEGVRPGNVVRVRPASWPLVNLPREEYLNDGSSTSEERFPTPAIFPKY